MRSVLRRLVGLNRAPAQPQQALRVDVHSHLLPGIDDGAETLNESLDMARAFADLGYQTLIVTPHVMSHRYPNESEQIRQSVQTLNRALQAHGIDVEVRAAAEYYLDDDTMARVERGDILTLGENYLLFELPSGLRPPQLLEQIHEIKVAGYQPVLAHPERYAYFHADRAHYLRLKQAGVLFQLNAVSLGGFYGKAVKQAALHLVKQGLVDFVGSDAHRLAHLQALQQLQSTSAYRSLLANNPLRNNALR